METTETRPKVSIIIPVYNVKEYLRRCFESILDQTFSAYEVIVVDDGSTDGGGLLCDELGARDARVRVFHQENGGLSAARNAGLARARGEYIAFLDSDDYVMPNFLERLLKTAETQNADIVMCQYQILLPNGKILFKHPGRNQVLSAPQAIRRLYRDVSVHHFAWNKLYKRALFFEAGFSFPSMIFEDIASVHELFHQADKVVFIQDILYNYCQRKNSLFATIHSRRLNDYVRAMEMTKEYLERNGLFSAYRAAFHFGLTHTLLTVTGDVLLMHIREHRPGLWSSWNQYWNRFFALYDRTPAAARRKAKQKKKNISIEGID